MVDVANIHLPVLLDDCVNLMAPALEHENAIAVDCTLGLAGHSIAFLKAAPQARLIGIDRDSEALGLATERMEREGLADRFIPVHAAFDQLDQVLADQDIERVDAVFMDLGLSSLQIDETDRGFSYSHDAPLDMRMDVSQPLTAERILATYDAAELVRIFKEYGEERFSRQIARAIVARRDKEPFTTTAQLNRLVDEVVPQAHRPAGNPAKRVFQALRIEVNGELDKLASTLPQAANRLHVGGTTGGGVLSFARRQNRQIVHGTRAASGCSGWPACHTAGCPTVFTDLTRGAIKADEHEIAANPRSASVRLRAVEVSREIPSRWRKRFTQTAQGLNDVKIQGSASPGRAKNTARIRTRRG